MKELESIIIEVYNKGRKNKFTFLTGAGISSDSGIPTYRGSDGIWIKGTQFHKPEDLGTLKYFLENPEEVWEYVLNRKKMFNEAIPNSSHLAIAEIEKMLEERFHLITQNVDGLHRKAGNKNIFEIHGNYDEVKCSKGCAGIFPFPSFVKEYDIQESFSFNELELLKCPKCSSWLRPNILWFDENYDERTNKRISSLKIAKNTGLLFIIGTSGATNLPIQLAETTLKYGGYIVDINIEDNAFSDLIKDKKRKLIIREQSSTILPVIENIIKNCNNRYKQSGGWQE